MAAMLFTVFRIKHVDFLKQVFFSPEKERQRQVQVVMDDNVLLLKHSNNLFEAKLVICELFYFYYFFSLVLFSGFRDGLPKMFPRIGVS